MIPTPRSPMATTPPPPAGAFTTRALAGMPSVSLEDLAAMRLEAVSFFLGERAGYISGQVLDVAGGPVR